MKLFRAIMFWFSFFLVGWFVSDVFGAEPAAKPAVVAPADVQTVPNIKQNAPTGETFGRRQPKQDDEGLKKLVGEDFRIPRADPFAGFRIILWGISIAGVLIGLFVAAVVIVFTLRFLRKTAAPAVTGVPDASLVALGVLDNIIAKIENRRAEIEAEREEIDKRLGKTTSIRKTKAR